MGIIKLNNIRIYAFHGCMEEEARIGSDYLVNVTLHTDFAEAAASDKLNDTIDYVMVNRIVQEEMSQRSKLIEAVGKRIVDRFRAEFNGLEGGQVEIVKVSPPMGGHVDSVAVILEI